MKLFLAFAFLFHLCIAENTIKQVRFISGTSKFKKGTDGIIEVLGKNGKWGTVCNIGIDVQEAKVACFMLGFEATKALVILNSDLNPDYTQPIISSLLDCSSVDLTNENEIDLSNCEMRFNQPVDKCSGSTRKAHIFCGGAKRPLSTKAPIVIIPPTCNSVSSTIRLVDNKNSKNTTGGRVEYNVNGTWSTVCKLQFDNNAAKAICGSLCTNNATFYARTSVDYNQSPVSTPIGIYGLNCKNGASSISDCKTVENTKLKRNCEIANNPDVGVDCGPPVTKSTGLVSPDLQCDNPNMIVTFKYADNTDLELNMVNISTTSVECSFNVTRSANKDIVMVIPMALCGAKVSGDPNFLTFTLTIIRMVKSEGDVFKTSPLSIRASCRFPRDNKVGSGKIESHVITLPPISGNDTIEVVLGLYKDSAYTTNLTMPVTGLKIGTRLYANVVAEKLPPSFKLVLLNCFATPSDNRKGLPKHDLITNKCRVASDTNIQEVSRSEVKFNFKMYPLSKDDNPTGNPDDFLPFYLHCDTRKCDTDVDDYIDCSNTCNVAGKRKKRSVAFESSSVVQNKLDVGPLLFQKSLSDIKNLQFGGGSFVRSAVSSLLTPVLLSIRLLLF